MSHYYKKSSRGFTPTPKIFGVSSQGERGFTITELIVSISIMTVISTVVFLNQSTYTQSVALSNLADNLASSIIQAQAYGNAVRVNNPGEPASDFSKAYGLTLSLLNGGANTGAIFFIDRNNDKYYNGTWDCSIGGASECLSKIDMTYGNYLGAICLITSSGSEDCTTVKRVDISFLRPNLEAEVITFNDSGGTFTPANMRGVKLVLRSLGGLTRSVSVYKNGQVSVQ